jgi:hypothetical protein
MLWWQTGTPNCLRAAKDWSQRLQPVCAGFAKLKVSRAVYAFGRNWKPLASTREWQVAEPPTAKMIIFSSEFSTGQRHDSQAHVRPNIEGLDHNSRMVVSRSADWRMKARE